MEHQKETIEWLDAEWERTIEQIRKEDNHG